jgi:uncharacterized protein YggU (UPF0235/DUF167 family)
MDILRDEAILAVRVTPGAKRNAVTANEELLAFLSKKLNVRKSSLSVVKGQTSRKKLVSVSGMNQKEMARRLYGELDSLV